MSKNRVRYLALSSRLWLICYVIKHEEIIPQYRSAEWDRVRIGEGDPPQYRLMTDDEILDDFHAHDVRVVEERDGYGVVIDSFDDSDGSHNHVYIIWDDDDFDYLGDLEPDEIEAAIADAPEQYPDEEA